MSKEILVQTGKGECLVAILENGRLDDFHIEVDRYQSLLGNIYKGKVETILPSINAAFVNIGYAKNGFLYLTDAANPLLEEEVPIQRSFLEKIFKKPSKKNKEDKRGRKEKGALPLSVGQEILVQVVKDPFADKGPRLTTHVTFPGRFVVYMPYDKQAGVSRKIESYEERQRLRDILAELNFVKSGGFIVRTASLRQGKKEILRDAKFLYELWQKVYKKSEEVSVPALVYEEGELTWKIVRDYLTEHVERLIIDDEEEFSKIQKFVQTLIGREMVDKIQLYKGDAPLFESKHVSKELQKIYDTHIYAKSGAYVVIEQTEGLTVVDVNSGKFKVKASPGEAAFMVNMEVIPEIARQLRLRDLGGIIVIDFIDMTRDEHKRKVVDFLRRSLLKDPAKTEVNNISALGLVEMTRARTGKTIESISFGKCPFCDGRGRVKIP